MKRPPSFFFLVLLFLFQEDGVIGRWRSSVGAQEKDTVVFPSAETNLFSGRSFACFVFYDWPIADDRECYRLSTFADVQQLMPAHLRRRRGTAGREAGGWLMERGVSHVLVKSNGTTVRLKSQGKLNREEQREPRAPPIVGNTERKHSNCATSRCQVRLSNQKCVATKKKARKVNLFCVRLLFLLGLKSEP